MMHETLLAVGAGLNSRNWGGWLANEVFEYLLGVPEVIADAQLQSSLWRYKDKGGFEATMEELQSEASRSGDRRQLEIIEKAVSAHVR